jgi:hypothetical protein
LAQVHIEELHRNAARYRLSVRRRRAKKTGGKARAGRFQRAPAHS